MITQGIHKVLSKFTALQKVRCVSVCLLDSGDYDISYIDFVKEKNSFSKEGELKKLTKDKLSNSIYPTVLYVDGKGIISRFVQGDNLDEKQCLSQIQDFSDEVFVKQFSKVENGAIVSFVRKEAIQNILKTLGNLKQIDLFLGATIYRNIQHITSEYSSLPLWSLSFDGNKLVSLEKKKQTVESQIIQIENSNCNGHELYAYCIALECFQTQYLSLKTNQTFAEQKRDYYLGTLAKRIGVVFVSALLLALVINTLFFQSLRERHQVLSSQVTENNHILKELSLTQIEYGQKKELLVHIVGNESKSFAYYFDRIGQTMPKELQLQKMNCNPLLQDFKQGKESKFEAKILVLHGTTKDILAVNSWVEELKKESWIQEAKLVDYSKVNTKQGASFIIQLSI